MKATWRESVRVETERGEVSNTGSEVDHAKREIVLVDLRLRESDEGRRRPQKGECDARFFDEQEKASRPMILIRRESV